MRYLRKIFKTYKVNVVIDGPMEEVLKSSGTSGRMALWAGEQVLEAPDKNTEGTSRAKKKLQEELIPTPRVWRPYFERESSKEGYRVALLAWLAAFAEIRMKDLHVFVSSRLLVDQVEGHRVPRTEGAKKYREEVMDATTPFHRFRVIYLPKALNP
ncbi:hypothetical protein Tco_1403047 [Tanacetum coccineum]